MPSTPFFNGIRQREMAVRQYRAKSPMFFWDARILGAVFFVDLQAARALLPDPRLEAVAAGGRGVLGVFALSYGHSDLGAYNEVFVSVGVHAGASRLPPPLRTARALLERSLGAHTVLLPVDSEAALFGGLDIYNVPKLMAAIELSDERGVRTFTVRDPADGTLLFSFGSRKPKRAPGRNVLLNRQTLRNYSLINDRLAEARYELHTPSAALTPHGLNGPALTIGTHARSRLLADLKPGTAVASFHADQAEAILYEPTYI